MTPYEKDFEDAYQKHLMNNVRPLTRNGFRKRIEEYSKILQPKKDDQLKRIAEALERIAGILEASWSKWV